MHSTPPIPPTFHFIWTGPEFPYYARVAVESVLLSEPRGRVCITRYEPRSSPSRHLEHVAGYRRVQLRDLDAERAFDGLPAEVGEYVSTLRSATPGSRRPAANLLRYAILYREGGVYLDSDTLMLRSLEDLLSGDDFLGVERAWRHHPHWARGRMPPSTWPSTAAHAVSWALERVDAHLLDGRDVLGPVARGLHRTCTVARPNNAVFGARAGSPFVRQLLTAALDVDATVPLQLGTTLVADVASRDTERVRLLPEEVFFPVPPARSFRFFHGRPPELPATTRLVHYVASNHRALLSGVDAAQVRARRNGALFFRLAAEVQARAEGIARGADAPAAEAPGRGEPAGPGTAPTAGARGRDRREQTLAAASTSTETA